MATTTSAPGAGWDDWTGAEHADQQAMPAAMVATSPPKPPPGGGWEDWQKPGDGGGDPGGSPIATVVRCPITWDARAAQITLPEPQQPGYSVLAEVCIDGAFTAGKLPTKTGVRLLDGSTVLVELTGTGGVAIGPEYTPPTWPGGKKTPVPVPPGTPYVALVVHPAGGGMGGGQPIKEPGMKGGQR